MGASFAIPHLFLLLFILIYRFESMSFSFIGRFGFLLFVFVSVCFVFKENELKCVLVYSVTGNCKYWMFSQVVGSL